MPEDRDDIWLAIGWDKNQQKIDAMRSAIGVRQIEEKPWVTQASADAVAHFALGIGDDHRRWFETTAVPPSFLYAASPSLNATLCPVADGWQWQGANWRWHVPVPRDATIVSTAWVESIDDRPQPAGGMVHLIRHRAEFHTDDGTLIAEATAFMETCLVGAAREKIQPPAPLAAYDLDELVEIFSVYAREDANAGTVFFDDVQVGDKLPVMAKGPITPSGTIAYLQGIGGLALADRIAWRTAQRGQYDTAENWLGVPEMRARVHWNGAFARQCGLPGAAPPASARSCWLIHQITDWMGDRGFLRAARCEINGPDPEGEALLIRGVVTRRYTENDGHFVNCEQVMERRDGSISATGNALIELPARK